MASAPFICARCVRSFRQTTPLSPATARRTRSTRLAHTSICRPYSSSSPSAAQSANHDRPGDPTQSPRQSNRDPNAPSSQAPEPTEESPQGALSRRLEQATEEALLTGGRAGRKAVLEESGFSEELKERLLAKVQDAQFRSQHAGAFAAAELDNTETGRIAGQGTRDIASAKPWTGNEDIEDTVLRMLTDAHKPLARELRGRPKVPEVGMPPVDMRIRGSGRGNVKPGQRVASARERASVYAGVGGIKESEAQGLSQQEQEARRKEFRERFEPAARAVPATMSGLAALANERIEDAIARGQFKNIPRGKGVERDTRADNPFIDTTEYIMNKMIKRQEIVPPWIEKQQELVKTAGTFRARLRNDWKRHAARMISAGGGTLEEKMATAREYAAAEARWNPRRRNVDDISVPTNVTEDPVMVRIRGVGGGVVEEAEAVVGVEATATQQQQQLQAEAGSEAPSSSTPSQPEAPPSLSSPPPQPQPEPAAQPPKPTITHPFRDPTWEATERSYMETAITNLNNITRSYNLMAPELAKKPYFNLERELNNCFADVAPQLAEEIKVRANRPVKNSLAVEKKKGILDRFANEGKGRAKVYENRSPHYGFREMWRDLFR